MKTKTFYVYQTVISTIFSIAIGLVVVSCTSDSTIEVITYDIPHVYINTVGGMGVESKEDYVGMTAKIAYSNVDTRIETIGKIRGRGHSTWEFDKKPYKIKFNEKQKPFGFPANRDWVLLADINDRSLLRTVYMAELSKAAEMDFSIHYQHVNLFLNEEFRGVYLFTDHIEKAKERVNIEDDGYLMKFDGYYYESPLFLVTDEMRRIYTFKYPDADEGKMIEGDDNWQFISSFMNDMESALFLLEDDPDNTEYLSYIDPVSFAKWYLVAELMAVVDVNQYYVLPSKSSTLKEYPIWDVEWSLGLWPSGVFGWTPDDLLTESRWSGNDYFHYLFLSNRFKDIVVQEWEKMKKNLPAVRTTIQKVTESISIAQEDEFELWPEAGKFTCNICFDTWEEEVEYTNDFFEKRTLWLDDFISQNVSRQH
jgi:hypothetical protein